MLSSQKNGLLRALIANSTVISLNSRTLLVCVTALLALSLSIYAILNNQFSAQHAERIDQLLIAKAQAIDHKDHSGHNHAMAMTPVYYHSGNIEGAQGTLHWPKNSAIQVRKRRSPARTSGHAAPGRLGESNNHPVGHAHSKCLTAQHAS
jgi:Tfp pilus assembly protein PilV